MNTIVAVTKRLTGLPPDPDGTNAKRSALADKVVIAYMRSVPVDFEDVLADLLTDLMHWADRNSMNFEANLTCAQTTYECEITP